MRSNGDATPIETRALPPLIADRVTTHLNPQPPTTVEEAFERGGRFSFLVENIFANAPVNTLIAKAPQVVDDLTIEFYMNPQRTGVEVPDPALLVTKREIGLSGRVEVELPGGVPLFEVLRTSSGRIPMGRDGQIFHVGGQNFGVGGERARCIGCHAGHSMIEVPTDTTWTNVAPSAEIIASSSGVNPEVRWGASPARLLRGSQELKRRRRIQEGEGSGRAGPGCSGAARRQIVDDLPGSIDWT